MKNKKMLMILFWLFIWQCLALWVNNEILLASPIESVIALSQLVLTADFWWSLTGSLVRIGMGFLLGVMVACGLAALAAKFRWMEALFAPVISLLRAVPVASFVVLLLICWGSSVLSVSICFLIVMPIIYINVLNGIKNTDKKLLEMASVFRMGQKARFFYIYRPALRPFLESGLKLALGMCWKSGVAAEVIGTPNYSIGEKIYMSKIYLDTADLFAWTAVVILLSLAFEKLIMKCVHLFMCWEPECEIKRGQKENKKGASIALSCQEISKKYGSLNVIENFTKEYQSGQTYYFTEPSGSGKTTLFRLISGLEQADSGRIFTTLISGEDTEVLKESVRFSYAFQEDRLCEEYSAWRNVELVAGQKGAEALRKVLQEDALYKPCNQLSGGMRRRVAVVRAMEADSDCVILDEPFAGLDEDNRGLLMEYIRKKQNGRILLIASHVESK